MNVYVTVLLVTAALFISGCASHGGSSSGHTPFVKERFYNKDGTYQGYSTQSGQNTRYYNTNSQYQGYSKSTGGKK